MINPAPENIFYVQRKYDIFPSVMDNCNRTMTGNDCSNLRKTHLCTK